MDKTGIVLLGLGPGEARFLTREAEDWLTEIDEVYFRASLQGVIDNLTPSTRNSCLENIIGKDLDPILFAEKTCDLILSLGQREQGVTLAVAGHPLIGDHACSLIFKRARQQGIPVRVIAGMSELEIIATTLKLSLNQITIVDAYEIMSLGTPPFPPSQPALVTKVESSKYLMRLKGILLNAYPETHTIGLIHNAGGYGNLIDYLPLGELEESAMADGVYNLFIPALAFGTAFEDFQQIIARLRSPEGCPWDRAQTHATLKPYLIEESYEALEALDLNDMASLQEELGDILLQIVLHAQIGTETGEFRMSDVLQTISDKMVRRHPHVFSDGDAKDVAGVIHKWEQIKAEERRENGNSEKKGMLDGIPLNLPALVQSQHIQERAQRVGFDWPEIRGVIKKVYEELDELKSAHTPEEQISEAGDVLFAFVNMARWLHVDAESALRESNRRFKKRFAFIEQAAELQGKTLDDLSFSEMDALWDQAKVQFKLDEELNDQF